MMIMPNMAKLMRYHVVDSIDGRLNQRSVQNEPASSSHRSPALRKVPYDEPPWLEFLGHRKFLLAKGQPLAKFDLCALAIPGIEKFAGNFCPFGPM